MAAGASAVLAVVGAGAAGIATLTGGEGGGQRIVTEAGQAAPAPAAGFTPGVAQPAPARPHAERHIYDKSYRTATRPPQTAAAAVPAASPSAKPPAPTSTPSAEQSAELVQTTRTEVETREIPYETRFVQDPDLPRGARQTETPGVPGVETLRYLVTLTDGRATDRKLIDAVVTRQPQHRVIALGARPAAPKRNCGEALNFCVPLGGRRAICPKTGRTESREEDASIPLPDLALNTDLGSLEGLAC